jgi:hypothetical protein
VNNLVLAALAAATVVYATAALGKLSSSAYRQFRAGLAQTRLAPDRLLRPLAPTLTCCEAVVASLSFVALVTTALAAVPFVAVLALAAATLLTVALAVGVGLVLRRGVQAPCACFGAAAGRNLTGVHLVRNGVLLAVVTAGLVGTQAGLGQSGPAQAAVAAVAGAAAGLILTRVDDLAELFAPIRPAAQANRVTPAPDRTTPARRSHPVDAER